MVITIERTIHDCLQMKKITSCWIPHQLTDEQKQERMLNFVVEIWRNSVMVLGDYVIL